MTTRKALAAVPPPEALSLSHSRQRLDDVAQALNNSILGASDAVDALLSALVAGEHAFLVGAPGAAKSLLATSLARLVDARYFEYLMTRFTEPNEIFGPLDLAAFKAGQQRRVTTGMLPEAEVAFLDEGFKASSAILNALLTILNERKFANPAPVVTPLRSVFVASNEYPEGESLDALYDRLLLRIEVKYLVSDADADRMIWAELPALPTTPLASLADVVALGVAARAIPAAPATRAALLAIRAACREQGIAVSDRRWKAIAKLLQADAARRGLAEVGEEQLRLLASALVGRPEHREVVEGILAKHVAAWLADCRRLTASLDEVSARYEAVLATPVGRQRFSELAALAGVLEDLTAQAEALAKQKPRGETQALLTRLKQLEADVANGARSKRS